MKRSLFDLKRAPLKLAILYSRPLLYQGDEFEKPVLITQTPCWGHKLLIKPTLNLKEAFFKSLSMPLKRDNGGPLRMLQKSQIQEQCCFQRWSYMYRTIRHHENLQTRGGERSVIFNFRLSFRNNYCLTSINNCKGLSYKLFNLSPAVQIYVSYFVFIYSSSMSIYWTHTMTSSQLAW